MKFTWKTEWPAFLILLVLFAMAAWAWPATPARVPTHWGLDGSPNGWGTRAQGLLTLPALGLGLYLLMRVLPRLDPGRANYERFAGAYLTLRIAALAFIAALFAGMIAAFRGHSLDLRGFLLPLAGMLLIVIGNLLGKVRPNWFIGVRTPWTLSSKTSWTRSNRAAGWLLIVSGVLFILAGLIRAPWLARWVVLVPVLGVVAVVIHSYRVWKSDPDKVPPAGTSPAGDEAHVSNSAP